MTQLIPYLAFSGKCREAMSFYKDCLDGELILQTVGDSPIANSMPPEAAQSIMHSVLTKDGFVLMASDMFDAEEVKRGNSTTLMISGNNREEIEQYFTRLSVGGQITAPFQKEFWGDYHGQVVDKFGVRWMMIFKPAAFQIDPGRQEIMIEWLIDAPREKVYQAYINPRLIPEWWGPAGFSTEVEKMDVHVGGLWRFVQKDTVGNQFAFHGVYHQVVPNEKVVNTFEFEGMPGHALLEIVTFQDSSDKTLLIDHLIFPTVADREQMVKSGMEMGTTESMQRLQKLLLNK